MEEIKEKKCTKCDEVKPIDCFQKDKRRKDGYSYTCKLCRKKQYNHNRENILKNKKEYYVSNRDDILVKKSEYRKFHREDATEYQKHYRKYNKTKINLTVKNYRMNNSSKISEYQRMYRLKNKDKLSEQKKTYKKRRLKSDRLFKIIENIRSRTYIAIHDYNLSKDSSTMQMLGCDKETLMNHLQSTGILYDPNFDIYNYDSSMYHIDHIKTFADVSKGIYTLEEVCHYTNLQILPVEINLLKGATSW